MKAYVCKICGYVHFGEEAPEKCPQCGASQDKFELRKESEENRFRCQPVRCKWIRSIL